MNDDNAQLGEKINDAVALLDNARKENPHSAPSVVFALSEASFSPFFAPASAC